MNAKMAIDDRVISSRFGVGTITSIDDMAGSDFFIITPDQSTLRVMVPINSTNQMRHLAKPSRLEGVLETLNNATPMSKFESKKDMIAHYKELAKGCSLQDTIDAISQLTMQPNKGAMEQKLLKTMIDTLSLEISTVMDQNIDSAKESILARLGNQ